MMIPTIRVPGGMMMPLRMLLELDESHLGLSSHGHIDPRGKVGHPRSPLGNLTYLAKEEMDAILVQLHLSQNVASIGSLEDELCTPRACLTQCINTYIHTYIHTYRHTYMHACIHTYQ